MIAVLKRQTDMGTLSLFTWASVAASLTTQSTNLCRCEPKGAGQLRVYVAS